MFLKGYVVIKYKNETNTYCQLTLTQFKYVSNLCDQNILTYFGQNNLSMRLLEFSYSENKQYNTIYS